MTWPHARSGLAAGPFKEYDKNKIWLALVELAADLTAWTQMHALTSSDARTWELKRLRLRLWSIAARIARHARTQQLRYDRGNTWTTIVVAGLGRLDRYRSSA
ncbi:transposase [Gordonia sp. VNK21]|uniref:transposase n=1 Tax=Gordonia sp. VNK21 TaxID=3382483 RepID=UPI0038D48698